MCRRVLCQRRKYKLCFLVIATVLVCTIFVHTTDLLRRSQCTAESTTQALTNTATAGIESGGITGSSLMKATNGSHEIHTTCYSSSLLYWPNDQQWTIQPLFSKREASVFMDKIRFLRVVSLEKGCSTSKPLNRLATLEDGTKVCCRRFKIGNIYSYHMNWLLGLHNVPPITAVKVNLLSEKWESVHDVAKAAGWRDGMSIVMEIFIDNLTEVYNFPYFKDNETSILTVPVAEKLPLTPLARKMMVQWSDMILFDFLIEHVDRKIYHDERKRPVRNLYMTPSSKLVLLDNESTFGLRPKHRKWYSKPISALLRRICAFRKHTMERILSLERRSEDSASPLTVLQNYIKANDSYTYSVIPASVVEKIERNIRERIDMIKSRLLQCKSQCQ